MEHRHSAMLAAEKRVSYVDSMKYVRRPKDRMVDFGFLYTAVRLSKVATHLYCLNCIYDLTYRHTGPHSEEGSCSGPTVLSYCPVFCLIVCAERLNHGKTRALCLLTVGPGADIGDNVCIEIPWAVVTVQDTCRFGLWKSLLTAV
jgi:hypothetical protein